MPHNLDDKYLKEINHHSIIESIDEVFDGITSMLTSNALMYGSTINSILAGLPILGDLDIAVSSTEHRELAQNITDSVKWIQIGGNTVQESGGGDIRFRAMPSKKKSGRSNPYKDAEHLPISDVLVFEGVNGANVQLMESRLESGDPLEDALDVVRKVDFAFCGLAIDRWGRLLETIPHGYSDCLSRLIRIVDYQARLDPKRLKARIRKYVKRGWNLTFSIDQAIHNINRAKAEAARKKPAKKRSSKHWTLKPLHVKSTEKWGLVIHVRPETEELIGSATKCAEVINHFASNQGVKLERVHGARNGDVFYSIKNRFSASIAHKIVKRCAEYFEKHHGVTSRRLEDRKKRKRMQGKYGGLVESAGTKPGPIGYGGKYVDNHGRLLK